MIGAIAALVVLAAPCYQPPSGSPVVAAYPGVVRFNGTVANVRYVVVAQADGRTAT